MNKSLNQLSLLIVSSQTTHRSGIRKVLTDLGMSNKLIEVAADYNQAREILEQKKINLIISDNEIGKPHGGGMDLLEIHRPQLPYQERAFFLMVSSEPTPFILADFVLKGGDVVLAKPFKNELLTKIFNSTVAEKINISQEAQLMGSVEDALHLQQNEKAKELIATFANLESYQAQYAQGIYSASVNELDSAYQYFKASIAIKPEFKSLLNVIKTGVKVKKYHELLPFVKIWLKNFPLHHASIPDITRVILANEEHELMEELFQVFANQKDLDSFVKVPLAAGFALVSKKYIEKGDKVKAKEYALKSIENSCFKMPILSTAIENLVNIDEKSEAERIYLKYAPPLESVDDKVMDLKIRSCIYSKSKVLVECSRLISQKVYHPELFQIAISGMQEIGKDAQDLIIQAKKKFPDFKF